MLTFCYLGYVGQNLSQTCHIHILAGIRGNTLPQLDTVCNSLQQFALYNKFLHFNYFAFVQVNALIQTKK